MLLCLIHQPLFLPLLLPLRLSNELQSLTSPDAERQRSKVPHEVEAKAAKAAKAVKAEATAAVVVVAAPEATVALLLRHRTALGGNKSIGGIGSTGTATTVPLLLLLPWLRWPPRMGARG